MHELRLLRRRGLAGADGPDRLVSHYRIRKRRDARGGQHRLDLTLDDRIGSAGLPLLERFADAQDRRQPGGLRGLELRRDDLVGVAEETAAFRMTDDRMRAAD